MNCFSNLRRFGGWAISEEKWMEEKQNLITSLGSRMKEVDMEYYATVGYDSPWKQENRRNEVWLVKQKIHDDIGNLDNVNPPSSSNNDGYGDENGLETIPYEVLESKQVSSILGFSNNHSG